MSWAYQVPWTDGAAACDPSTVGSGKLSLLCESSLTHCPPPQGPRHLNLRTNHVDPTLNLDRAGQHDAAIGPTKQSQSFVPPP